MAPQQSDAADNSLIKSSLAKVLVAVISAGAVAQFVSYNQMSGRFVATETTLDHLNQQVRELKIQQVTHGDRLQEILVQLARISSRETTGGE